MMIRQIHILAMVALGVFAACAPPPLTIDLVRSQNRERLTKLSVGMSKDEVLSVMGTETIQTQVRVGTGIYATNQDLMRVTNPWRSETLKSKEGVFVEVLYYLTDMKAADNAVTDDELTPIVLEDSAVVGWGWAFLDANVDKYEIRIR